MPSLEGITGRLGAGAVALLGLFLIVDGAQPVIYELIEFYGRWSWQALESHPDAVPAALGEPVPGRTYEIDLGGTATHVCLESATSATILRKSTGSPDIAHLPVTELRPNLLMVAWQDADRTTTVHVYDFDSGEAHAVVGHGERRVRRARGTVRPAPTTNAPS